MLPRAHDAVFDDEGLTNASPAAAVTSDQTKKVGIWARHVSHYDLRHDSGAAQCLSCSHVGTEAAGSERSATWTLVFLILHLHASV